tara:strand:+ start:68730 stop:69323 length:594 start_codon:yes stop_codon:yes gene_type:complete
MAVLTEQRLKELRLVSNRVVRAKDFARTAHQGQTRDDGAEYFSHPSRVVDRVRGYSGDENTICAAWLHDTIEDCEGVTSEMLQDLFGSQVTSIVEELTLPEIPSKISPPHRWQYKTDLLVKKAGTMSNEAKLVKICDRIDNLNSAMTDWKPRRLVRYAIQGCKMLEAMRPLDPMHQQAANDLLFLIAQILIENQQSS